jgi:hypothetical protein
MKASQPPNILKSRLGPGERLIWWDQPRRGIVLRMIDFYLIPFSLVFFSFAIFYTGMMLTFPNAPSSARLMGIGLVAFGIYALIGRFFHDAWRRGRLAYGLTDDRVLIATPDRCRSLAIDNLGEINMEEFGNGEGSIAFGREPFFAFYSKSWRRWTGKPSVPTLERIADADRVFAAIREAQRAARQR